MTTHDHQRTSGLCGYEGCLEEATSVSEYGARLCEEHARESRSDECEQRDQVLTEDCTVFQGYVQYHYGGLGCALLEEKSPPVSELKKGARIRITYDLRRSRNIVAIVLPPPVPGKYDT